MIHIKHKEQDRKKIFIEEWPQYEAEGWVKMEPWERATIPWHIDRTPIDHDAATVEPIGKKEKGKPGRKKQQPIGEDYTS